MGNCTPDADLTVLTPDHHQFLVDVKGQSTKNFWRIRDKAQLPNLYYVLCFVGDLSCNRYFCFSHKQLADEMERYKTSGVKFDPRFSGINWGQAHPFEDKWDHLPI